MSSLILLLVASCTLGVPEVAITPTLAPTSTPTDVPTTRPTRILIEPTDAPLPTALPSNTPTLIPTATETLAPTLTETTTPSPTPTQTATATATNTLTPTVPTETDIPTVTPLPTIAPTGTDTPEPTLIPPPPPTQTPRIIPPTVTDTPAPTLIPTVTDTPPPTIDATPTFVTLEAETDFPAFVTFTPSPGAPQPEGVTALPTLASFPTSTPLPPTVDPNSVVVPPTVSRNFAPAPVPQVVPRASSGLLDFTIGSSSGVPVASSAVNTGGVNAELYAQNPINPDEFAMVNNVGQIYLGSGEGLGTFSAQEPFTRYHYEINNIADNNAPVVNLTWSDTGRLAFIIRGDSINVDGVWFLTSASAPFQLLRDCPREGHPGCQTVLPDGRDVYRWTSQEIKWQPNTTDNILIVLDLLEEGRRGFVIQTTYLPSRERLPRLYRYDSANWSVDGTRVLVSGRDPGGQHVIGWLNPETGELNVFFNGTASGIYTRDAVERPNGTILAFAAATPGGVVRLVDGGGRTLSSNVGVAPPRRIEWNANRDAALVQTSDGRSYYVSAGGAISDASSGVDAVAASGSVPPAPPPPVGSVPAGVVEGSVYFGGQQLRVLNEAGLNVRQQPSTGTSIVGSLQRGDYIVVVAGPFDDGQYTWWRVQDAYGTQGWVAGTIDGFSTIAPP